jgi:hypothetical protein
MMNKLNYISYAIFAVVFQVAAVVSVAVCVSNGDYGIGFAILLILGGFGQLFWKRAAKYKDR